MTQHTEAKTPRRPARRRRSGFRLPAAVLLVTLALVGGRSLLSIGLGAEPSVQDAPAASLSAAVAEAVKPMLPPAPVPTPEPYDFSSPVPLSDTVEDDWFSDAAFLGDSLTDGLLLYSGIRGAANLSYKGLTVQSVRTDNVIRTDAGKVTPLSALEQKTYGKIYILLGVNELGWYNDERFSRAYGELIDLVRKAQPDAQIYLQTLLPVTAEKSAGHEWLRNDKVEVYNGLIAALAEEKQVYLLDTHAAFVDEDGALPAEGSTDGVHLTKSYYKIWLDYLRTHTVSE